MTRLSVNINKIATLRNARGGNNPNLLKVALDCERYGAQGITVHPRPDERHIRYQDVLELKEVVHSEFNIEGYPDSRYLELVSRVEPDQATLVPDPPDVLTSNAGWDTIRNRTQLVDSIQELKQQGIRTSLFVDPNPEMIAGAAEAGADRVELYTERYAGTYHEDSKKAIEPYLTAALAARNLNLGLNAGHDLDLFNLKFLRQNIPFLDEVSIGHALICDSLYYGLENAIQQYLRALK